MNIYSRVLSTAPHPFGFKEDFLLPPLRLGPYGTLRRRLEWRKYYDFDILHSHSESQLPKYVLSHWRRRLIQHYHAAKVTGPLYSADVPSFASVPNILKVIPSATWIPLPVETEMFSPGSKVPHDTVRIGYCMQSTDPTKQLFVPCKEIDIAAKKLGTKAQLFPLQNIVPHGQMPRYYGQIDLWVDRVGLDFYGFAAVEAAATGIPVVTQIGENERAFAAGCPFVSVDRTGVTEAIISLVGDKSLREALGIRAREYVTEVHDSIKVAKRCLATYESIMEERECP